MPMWCESLPRCWMRRGLTEIEIERAGVRIRVARNTVVDRGGTSASADHGTATGSCSRAHTAGARTCCSSGHDRYIAHGWNGLSVTATGRSAIRQYWRRGNGRNTVHHRSNEDHESGAIAGGLGGDIRPRWSAGGVRRTTDADRVTSRIRNSLYLGATLRANFGQPHQLP